MLNIMLIDRVQRSLQYLHCTHDRSPDLTCGFAMATAESTDLSSGLILQKLMLFFLFLFCLIMLINIPIMLAYASIHEITYYAGNYAGIIRQPLIATGSNYLLVVMVNYLVIVLFLFLQVLCWKEITYSRPSLTCTALVRIM